MFSHCVTGLASLDWTPSSLQGFFDDQTAAVAAQLPSIAPSPTERIHCIAWSDWATAPTVELARQGLLAPTAAALLADPIAARDAVLAMGYERPDTLDADRVLDYLQPIAGTDAHALAF